MNLTDFTNEFTLACKILKATDIELFDDINVCIYKSSIFSKKIALLQPEGKQSSAVLVDKYKNAFYIVIEGNTSQYFLNRIIVYLMKHELLNERSAKECTGFSLEKLEKRYGYVHDMQPTAA